MLQVNTASQVKVLETDLQAATASVKTLRERNQDLGKTAQGRGITSRLHAFVLYMNWTSMLDRERET